MSRRVALRSLLLAAALLLPAGLGALPAVLSPPFTISHPFTPPEPGETRSTFEPAATARASGDFVVEWGFVQGFSADITNNGSEGRIVSPSGQLGASFGNLNARDFNEPGCPALAATSADGFAAAILVLGETNGVLALGVSGPAGSWVDANAGDAAETRETDACPGLAANASGAVALTWPKTLNPPGSTIYQYRGFDPTGQPLTPPFRLDAAPAFTEEPPAVGIDRDGRAVVVWRGTSSPGLYARRFGADGQPLGPALLIAASYADGPALSMAPEGDFAIAYTKPAPAGQPRALVLRRFAADGTPLGAPFSPGKVAGFDHPRTSTDRYGNFALSWRQGAQTEVQVFARSLAPRTGAFAAGPVSSTPATVALSNSGRLLAAWPAGSEVRGEIWQVLPEATFCAYRGNAFLCDTEGTGQAAGVFPFGLGAPLDVPLLGDVDGDGSVDPCVRRGSRFACDTARNGGQAEVKIDFGLPADLPLLGDVDGDGRADPCVHRGNQFLCDTRHDGGSAEVRIAFGVPSDVALLADVDGDGRADPCVYRAGVFLCDTAHDGVFAETRLDLRPALGGMTAGVPLLGDVDGDGRADACLYRSGALTCGLFPKAGGTPLAVVTQTTFGQPGDAPLLGYLGPR
jgi:hypothetical protein